jgi:eukaryotic-like serine/threonine-protein kinase
VTEPVPRSSPQGSVAARQRAASLIGRTISDRYKILDLVAMGGMGAVYRAQHLRMHKELAVKVLHPETEGFPELVARFEREAVAGAHVDHPNVAAAIDFGEFDGGSRFLVLEFITGVTLRELINKGPMPARRAGAIVRQVADALTAIHKKGIVHRDLKPRNIMVVDDAGETEPRPDARGAEELVKLIDFGLAKVPVEELSPLAQDVDDARRSLTAAGVVMGTIGYLAPEAAMGMRSVGPLADLYSLGVIFYQMLSAREPFDGADAATLFGQHRSAPVPPINERNPEVTVAPEVEAIVRRLLEKDPADRYPDAPALVAALDATFPRATSKRPSAPRPVSAPPTAVAPARVSVGPRQAVWIAGAIAAVAVAVAVVSITQGGGDAPVAQPTSSSPVAGPVGRPQSAPARSPSVVERLREVAERKDAAGAAAVLIEIADKDQAAFKDRAVQAEAAAVAEIAATGGRAADPIFDRLATALGTEGLDILYDLVAREQRQSAVDRGGIAPPTAAGPRSRAILGRPDVLARATPAMRVAYELRRSTCQHRPNLFPRAANDGDDRALEILTSMQPPACTRRDACCLEKHRELERAIAEIQARLRR